MADIVTLHGDRYSVYTRIIRCTLDLKSLPYKNNEVNPFAPLPPDYLTLHPFGRVPVLSHGPFKIYETAAICRYLDNAFHGAALRPENAKAIARMDQIIAIVDSYGYWPMVRQVFSHRVFRPLLNEAVNEDEISQGLIASKTVLAAFNEIAAEGHVLTGQTLTLADCHLAPMIDYFARAPEGRKLLQTFPSLWRWWSQISRMPFITRTDPNLSKLEQ